MTGKLLSEKIAIFMLAFCVCLSGTMTSAAYAFIPEAPQTSDMDSGPVVAPDGVDGDTDPGLPPVTDPDDPLSDPVTTQEDLEKYNEIVDYAETLDSEEKDAGKIDYPETITIDGREGVKGVDENGEIIYTFPPLEEEPIIYWGDDINHDGAPIIIYPDEPEDNDRTQALIDIGLTHDQAEQVILNGDDLP